MDIREFFETNKKGLAEFAAMSDSAGSRADYAQGGGGNTSVKLADGLMAIKASGYRLSQITATEGYAVMNYRKVREFFSRDPAAYADVESAGQDAAKHAAVEIDGLAALRPSVEAGFHAILRRFVLHTHAIYANLVSCAKDADSVASEVMRDFSLGGVSYAVAPYGDPGVKLTFLIKAAIENARDKLPNVIFLKNHGIIVTDDDAATCVQIHEEVNKAAQRRFSVSPADFPRSFAVRRLPSCPSDPAAPESAPDSAAPSSAPAAPAPSVTHSSAPAAPVPSVAPSSVPCFFASDTPWLRETLANDALRRTLSRVVLYPDQMVYLPKVALAEDTETAPSAPETAPMAAPITAPSAPSDEISASVDLAGNALYYTSSEKEALTREETLAGAAFVMGTLMNNNVEIAPMGASDIDFISNWESEKYRKSIAR